MNHNKLIHHLSRLEFDANWGHGIWFLRSLAKCIKVYHGIRSSSAELIQLSAKVQLFRRGFFLKISSLKAPEQATGIDRFAIEVRSRLVRESLSLWYSFNKNCYRMNHNFFKTIKESTEKSELTINHTRLGEFSDKRNKVWRGMIESPSPTGVAWNAWNAVEGTFNEIFIMKWSHPMSHG